MHLLSDARADAFAGTLAGLHVHRVRAGRPGGGLIRNARALAELAAGAHPVDLDPGQGPGEGVGPGVAQQMDHPTVGDQLAGERLGRKAMAAGAAGGKHEGLHESVLPASRRRVRASAIPIASASASIEDPP